ncbi:hypothetical protein LINGRAHAP2_LOCUS17939, partial [Linum grandiflorum]
MFVLSCYKFVHRIKKTIRTCLVLYVCAFVRKRYIYTKTRKTMYGKKKLLFVMKVQIVILFVYFSLIIHTFVPPMYNTNVSTLQYKCINS